MQTKADKGERGHRNYILQMSFMDGPKRRRIKLHIGQNKVA